MNVFKRLIAALDGAVSTYRAQRCLGYSEDTARRRAAMYYADMAGCSYAAAQAEVSAELAVRRDRVVPGGTL